MEYETILRPYDLAFLVGDAKGKVGNQAAYETEELNAALNKYAKDNWTVKESGTIMSGRDLIFWALLERPERKEGF